MQNGKNEVRFGDLLYRCRTWHVVLVVLLPFLFSIHDTVIAIVLVFPSIFPYVKVWIFFLIFLFTGMWMIKQLCCSSLWIFFLGICNPMILYWKSWELVKLVAFFFFLRLLFSSLSFKVVVVHYQNFFSIVTLVQIIFGCKIYTFYIAFLFMVFFFYTFFFGLSVSSKNYTRIKMIKTKSWRVLWAHWIV